MLKRIVFVAFIFPLVLFGQIEEVRRITEKLCSEEFHGRGYVNNGDSIAAQFLVNEFKGIGLSPINGNYLQHFDLSVNTFPDNMSLRLNDRDLTPGVHFVVDPASAGYQGEFFGLEINAEVAMNEERLVEAVNSVLRDKKYNGLILNFTNTSADTIKLLRGLGNELSTLMPIVEVTNSKFTWSVAQEQTKYLYAIIKDSVYHANGNFQFDVDAKWIQKYSSQNVIARIPGKRKCNKTIVFSAHYDHLGRMGSETYFPGANDNASGTAMLISMAKYFQEHPTKYNLVFIAFGGEEAGLVGSKYFVDHPLVKLKKIKFLVNLDIMGSGEEGITVVNATLFEKEFAQLQEINANAQLLAQIKSRGPAANSDHYWFTMQGVPAFFIYTMGPNKHYHDVFDTYSELSFVEYQDITKLLVEFVGKL